MLIIGEIEKNSRERIWVTLEEFKGHKFIDLRVYYPDNEGTWRPTPKGIALTIDTAGQVVTLLQNAMTELQERDHGGPKNTKAEAKGGRKIGKATETITTGDRGREALGVHIISNGGIWKNPGRALEGEPGKSKVL